MLHYFKKILYLSILIVPSLVFGAQAYFVIPQNTVGVGKEAVVDVYVDTENESVNAVEGSVEIPKGQVEMVDIKNGNSSINFWVDRPHIEKQSSVVFSGIVPGGITGKIYLFSIVVKTIREGDSLIDFGSLRVLKNDGTGTELKVNMVPSRIFVGGSGEGNALNKEDAVKPEDFKPEVAQNSEMFEGKYFLVFTAQDKGLGIDYYHVKEGFFGTYKKAESPYVLNNQKLNTKIYVKAVDKKGNERIVIVNPQNPLPWYQDYVILGILLVVCLIGFFSKTIRRRFTSLFVR